MCEEIWNATVESVESVDSVESFESVGSVGSVGDQSAGMYRFRLSPAHYNHVLTPGQEADWGCKLSAGGLRPSNGKVTFRY